MKRLISRNELRRAKSDLILTFKIVKGSSNDLFEKFFVDGNVITRGHSLKIAVPNFIPRTNAVRNHFVWRVVPLWNNLSSDIVSADTLYSFRHRLNKSFVLPSSLIRV